MTGSLVKIHLYICSTLVKSEGRLMERSVFSDSKLILDAFCKLERRMKVSEMSTERQLGRWLLKTAGSSLSEVTVCHVLWKYLMCGSFR